MILPDDPSPWLAVFGRAHPLLLHLPLGIVPCTALLEFGALAMRREAPRAAVLALACFGAVAGAFAAWSGLVLANEPGYGGDNLARHETSGIVLAALLIAGAVLAALRPRWPFRIVLAASLVAMLPAGHLGGSLTHGDDFLFAPVADALPANATDYERTIAPILKRSCTKCHNPNRRKGELDLSTPDAIKSGAESGDVVIPGNPDESELLRLCLLPEDHDDVMPPTGKQPRPTPEQIETLRAWIRNGARFD